MMSFTAKFKDTFVMLFWVDMGKVFYLITTLKNTVKNTF